jgi:hypothetical protein
MATVADQVQDRIEQTEDSCVKEEMAKSEKARPVSALSRATRIQISNWRPWALGGLAAVALIAVMFIAGRSKARRLDDQRSSIEGYSELKDAAGQPRRLVPAAEQAVNQAVRQPAAKSVAEVENGALSASRSRSAANPQAPMIAPTASLIILVKDFAAGRASLDSILAKHGGYNANLTVDTPENGQRHFQASLRIPSNQLDSALADLKKLGRTFNESQSGEEVTQQHADLVARLQNSRQTEQRLRAILEQRTGKISDVLEVEQEISRVRGEIESMESEQKALEHRVTFALVNLQLVEEYREKFNASPMSTSGRLRNAFVEGMRNAFGTVLGFVLFLGEFGPSILIWAAILGFPVFLGWRRYRKLQARA